MTWINKAQFEALRSQMHTQIHALRNEMYRGFDSFERRFEQVDRRLDQLTAEVASLRSDLTQVALPSVLAARRPGSSEQESPADGRCEPLRSRYVDLS